MTFTYIIIIKGFFILKASLSINLRLLLFLFLYLNFSFFYWLFFLINFSNLLLLGWLLSFLRIFRLELSSWWCLLLSSWWSHFSNFYFFSLHFWVMWLYEIWYSILVLLFNNFKFRCQVEQILRWNLSSFVVFTKSIDRVSMQVFIIKEHYYSIVSFPYHCPPVSKWNIHSLSRI